MKDRVSVNPGRVLITPENGAAAYYATVKRADNPTQEGSALNKKNLLPDETAIALGLNPDADPQVKDAFLRLKEHAEAGKWELLAEYKTAGSYTFTVPDDVDELGVLVLGGGGSGGLGRKYGSSNYVSLATGGGSGEIIQTVLSKANGDFSTGQQLAVVVGAGGQSVVRTESDSYSEFDLEGNNGGSSSFASVVATGGNGGKADGHSNIQAAGQTAGSGGSGQSSDAVIANYIYNEHLNNKAPHGLVAYATYYDTIVLRLVYSIVRKVGWMTKNLFDPGDTHVYCGAGGGAYADANGNHCYGQKTDEREKGHAGAGVYSLNRNTPSAENATAPGDGGGGLAITYSNPGTWRSGAGADGLVLVYGRKKI